MSALRAGSVPSAGARCWAAAQYGCATLAMAGPAHRHPQQTDPLLREADQASAGGKQRLVPDEDWIARRSLPTALPGTRTGYSSTARSRCARPGSRISAPTSTSSRRGICNFEMAEFRQVKSEPHVELAAAERLQSADVGAGPAGHGRSPTAAPTAAATWDYPWPVS